MVALRGMGTLSPGEQPLDVTRFDVESASDLLGTWVRRTPVVELERGAFGVPGRLVLKLELLQHTGSFKPRGAFNRMLTADIDETGVLAASGGNFGLAVVAGQGTLAQELGEQEPTLDTVIVAVGGGGLIGGIAAWFASDVRVIGVEPGRCPTLTAALAAGKPVD